MITNSILDGDYTKKIEFNLSSYLCQMGLLIVNIKLYGEWIQNQIEN